MVPRHLWVAILMIAGVAPLAGQSSIFGVRGIGMPGRGLTAKSLGTGGSLGLFDGESSRNPAALTLLGPTTAAFTGTMSWRTSEVATQSSSARGTRFPQLSVGGTVPGTRLALGFSHSLFADRDFSLVTDGVELLGGVPVLYRDTTSSRGGVSNLRLTAAWRPFDRLAIGGGVDFLTGQNQLTTRRVWDDENYAATRLTGEVSNRATGVTVGILAQPRPWLQLAASAQRLGDLDVRQDSQETSWRVPLPTTVTAGVRVQPHAGLYVSGMVTSRSWDRGDSAVRALHGVGANGTLELGVGVEVIRNRLNREQFPLRLGARWADLPYPLYPGAAPRESAFSIGTGIRFARQSGGLDVALERITREEAPSFRETAWHLTFGITIRAQPGGR